MNSSLISVLRTKNYFRQLKGSFVFKLFGMILSFILVPIVIQYLGYVQYGIWSTLLSIISWIVIFDIGIGNGLRNKVAESLAKNNILIAQSYISTAYILIGFISLLLIIVFIIVSIFIPWQSVFNTTILSNNELCKIVRLAVLFVILNFWLSLINQVVNGLQKTSLVVFNQFLSNFFSLIFIYLLYLYSEPALINLVITYGLSLLSANILFSLWFYNKNYQFIPKISLYNKKLVKSITLLGFKFFIIQIAVIVIFTTDKILIIQLFGPKYVTQYDVVFKFFSIITTGYSLVLAPLWSAYSDAYHRNDFKWIKQTIKNQFKLFFLIICIAIGFVFLSNPVINLWIGNNIEISYNLIFAMGLFIVISVWNNIFSYFLNAINKLNLQIYTSIVAMFINIPLSVFLVKYFNFGPEAVIYGTIISLSIFAIFGPLQTYYLIRKNNV